MNLSDYQSQFLEFLFGGNSKPRQPNAEIYRRGVEAKAVRALENSFPTVKALLGPSRFEGLSVDYLRTLRKQSGDWSDFGWGFPSWIISHRISDQVPYLSDVARLDHTVSGAERNLYDDVSSESFLAIGEELSRYSLVLNRGVQFFRSTFPVVSIWEAHKSQEPQDTLSFAQAKRMIARGKGQNALVYRAGWQGMAEAISDNEVVLLERLRAQRSIAEVFEDGVLQAADFSSWLQTMISKGIIVGAKIIH